MCAQETPVMVRLKRIRAGLYETRDGAWEIVQGDSGCSWAGQWIVRSKVDRYSYSDPIGSLREARAYLGTRAKS